LAHAKEGVAGKFTKNHFIMKELSFEEMEEIDGGRISWSWSAPLTGGDVACAASVVGAVLLGGVTFGLAAAIGGALVVGSCMYLVHND
jgi:hypothetical protein